MVHFKRFLALLALSLCIAGTTIHNTADISGTGTNQQVSATQGARALWVQFVAPSTNSSVVRVGDININSTRGTPIAAGGGYFFPVVPQSPGPPTKYDLSTIYVLVQSGDKVSVEWSEAQ